MDTSNLFRVDGMVAVITGGGTGIGLTMAKALASNGAAKVYILGRRQEILDDAAKAHEALVPLRCDVTSKDDLQSAVDTITKDVGYVNLLVANSGVIGPSVRFNPAFDISELRKATFTDFAMESMNEVLDVNITGAFFTMTAFLELLDAGNKHALKGGFGKPAKEGSGVQSIQSQVIFTSSISAFSRAWPSTPPYMTSKVAVMHLAKFASTNLARFGIRVNGIAPGLFPSELASVLIGDRDPGKETIDDPKFIPARKFGGDEEMAGAILYLCGLSGSYTNGSILVMDGGRLSVMTASY
ncbi:Short-chain dehydrogenase/reductase SAT3 [Colletotrichum trifolii]|uniref:Short-chain dehydrogenase/reductase SAT3 n=1 Tax=Colletotrichum trifolii TaxID=5466 RepID=A0A4R8R500_COLTR|nr:Short-chain dehydrogenase/reductase SAT3 [Colletotrichum trifolii]